MDIAKLESYWYDIGFKTARKETIDKVLETIDNEVQETKKNKAADYNGTDSEFFAGYIDAADNIRAAVQALLEDADDGNDVEEDNT